MCLLIHEHIAYMVWALLVTSEVTTTSKQCQRSNPPSHLKSITPVTNLSMWALLLWYGPIRQPPRPLQPPKSLRGQIGSQIWNQWVKAVHKTSWGNPFVSGISTLQITEMLVFMHWFKWSFSEAAYSHRLQTCTASVCLFNLLCSEAAYVSTLNRHGSYSHALHQCVSLSWFFVRQHIHTLHRHA